MFQVGQWTSKAQFVSYVLGAALLASVLAERAVESSVQRGATLIPLGTAQRVAVLGATTATNTGATTVFGNLGVSPGTTVTGFPSGIVSRGKIHVNDAIALQAQRDVTTASNSSVRIINGGSGCPQIDWQVGSSATLGPGTMFEGNLLALTSITLTTGASLRGRALAQTGAVTMDTNNVSITGC